eukprot:1033996-Rhodomonas_salina.2
MARTKRHSARRQQKVATSLTISFHLASSAVLLPPPLQPGLTLTPSACLTKACLFLQEGWTSYEKELEKLEVRGARLRSVFRACDNEQKMRKTALQAQLKERGRNLQHLCKLAVSG